MRYLIIILCIIGIMGANIIFILESTNAHELAHYQINNYFNVASHIELDYLGTSKTIIDGNFINEEDRGNAYLAHGINEAIGYQQKPLFECIIILISICVIIGMFILNELFELNENLVNK